MCWLLLFPRFQASYSWWYQRKTDIFTETYNAKGSSATGDHLCWIKNAVIFCVPVQRAMLLCKSVCVTYTGWRALYDHQMENNISLIRTWDIINIFIFEDASQLVLLYNLETQSVNWLVNKISLKLYALTEYNLALKVHEANLQKEIENQTVIIQRHVCNIYGVIRIVENNNNDIGYRTFVNIPVHR